MSDDLLLLTRTFSVPAQSTSRFQFTFQHYLSYSRLHRSENLKRAILFPSFLPVACYILLEATVLLRWKVRKVQQNKVNHLESELFREQLMTDGAKYSFSSNIYLESCGVSLDVPRCHPFHYICSGHSKFPVRTFWQSAFGTGRVLLRWG